MTNAGGELTEYFQAAVANSISGVQAPVDTMEQQAEHCQVEEMHGEESWQNKRWKEGRKERGGKGKVIRQRHKIHEIKENI